jgi:hypothetical protein
MRVNWAIYAPTPPEPELSGPSSIPPGAVSSSVFAYLEHLRTEVIPPDLQPLFAGSHDVVSIQPVYDVTVERYVDRRLALIGDASTLARPHTGSGATKAMQDAPRLEELGADHHTTVSDSVRGTPRGVDGEDHRATIKLGGHPRERTLDGADDRQDRRRARPGGRPAPRRDKPGGHAPSAAPPRRHRVRRRRADPAAASSGVAGVEPPVAPTRTLRSGHLTVIVRRPGTPVDSGHPIRHRGELQP